MNLTEQEAGKKWCPMARVGFCYETGSGQYLGAAVMNRTEKGHSKAGSLCIASACMLWQWDNSTFRMDGTDKKGIVFRLVYDEPRTGHCGLAK